MRRQRNAVGVLVKVSMVVLLLVACESVAAAGCGTALQAVELGRLSNTLYQVDHRLLSRAADLNTAIAQGGATVDRTGDAERLYGVVILGMQVRTSVDRLAVLTQLRDLMRQAQDRAVVAGAISSFATSAADVSAKASTRLAAKDAWPRSPDLAADTQHVHDLVRQIAALLSSCR